MGLLRQLWTFRLSIVMIMTPIVFLPVPIFYTSEAGRCAYAILIMAVYWMTEVMPMAATALLPVVLMPWLGVLGSKQICKNYLQDTNMLFVGGLLVAVAVERWNLHRRIALRVLLLVGSKPRWLMFGFMATTAFLSMWISNTATTAMMVPIVQAVLLQLEEHYKDPADDTESGALRKEEEAREDPSDKITATEESEMLDEPATPPSAQDAVFERMAKGLTLSVAYAANIGGTATLTGTPPNLVMKGQLDTIYGSGHGISFSSWFVFAFPNMVVCLFVAWYCLQLMFLGKKETFPCCFKGAEQEDKVAAVLRKEYADLGPMSFAEGAVLGHFILLALLWLTREPEFVEGWSYFFVPGYVTDACVAITIAVSLFMFPSQPPNFMCCRRKSDTRPRGPAPALLDWDTVHKKLAWSVVIVLGGGFALADACKESGLSQDIGEVLAMFGAFPAWAMVAILCTITAIFTTVTSNVATATIFLPILAQLAESIGMNPLYLMVPITITCSFAFMLPVATPPNAIVFAYGRIEIIDMVKAGAVLSVLCIGFLQIAINTFGMAYFDLGNFPDWAGSADSGYNTTTMASPVVVNCSRYV